MLSITLPLIPGHLNVLWRGNLLDPDPAVNAMETQILRDVFHHPVRGAQNQKTFRIQPLQGFPDLLPMVAVKENGPLYGRHLGILTFGGFPRDPFGIPNQKTIINDIVDPKIMGHVHGLMTLTCTAAAHQRENLQHNHSLPGIRPALDCLMHHCPFIIPENLIPLDPLTGFSPGALSLLII